MHRCEINYVMSHGHQDFTYGPDDLGLDSYEDKTDVLMAVGAGDSRLEALKAAVNFLLSEGLGVREAELRAQADDEFCNISHADVDAEMARYREAVEAFKGDDWRFDGLAWEKPLKALKNGRTRWSVFSYDEDDSWDDFEDTENEEGLALLAA